MRSDSFPFRNAVIAGFQISRYVYIVSVDKGKKFFEIMKLSAF